MSVYLGIDVGTQSVKALLLDAGNAGAVLASSSAPLELISTDDGGREQHASWWLEALRSCMANIREQIGPAGVQAVEGIGVSGQQHGFVPLNSQGEVLAPVKLWCDTSTSAECNEIHQAFGGEQACIQQLGNPILPGYTASKIRWLRNKKPEAYAQLATILLPHDYVNYYLTGELSMEYGDASGTGLLDIRTRRWHDGMLKALDPERDLKTALPKLLEAGEIVGRLSATIAAELGLSTGIPVSTGGGDNMMAAIGTGSVIEGTTTISLGTSGTVFAYADTPVIDPDAQLAAFCSSTGGWLPLLCTMNCTVATEQGRALFGLELDNLEQRVAAAPVGSEGVITLPFYNGERTPNLPDAKASIMGLNTSNTTADNLLRSAMEGASFGLRAGLEAFARLNVDTKSIRLTGGGASSGVWRQMIADNAGVGVDVLRCDEGAAFGAAIHACWTAHNNAGAALSLPDVCEEMIELDGQRHCEPEREAVESYRHQYQQYQRYVELMKPEFGPDSAAATN